MNESGREPMNTANGGHALLSSITWPERGLAEVLLEVFGGYLAVFL